MSRLTRVKVENFQSLADVEVEFPARESGGSLTTIVGASSTGKSALLRALHLWARNASSVHVRAGEKSTTVAADIGDRAISVTRGKALSTYTLDEEIFAKSGTTVPEEIVKAHGLDPADPDIHFSFQFDKPYLLAETGSVAATVFGRLTHANRLREAAREGARRAQAAKQKSAFARAESERIYEKVKGLAENVAVEQKRVEGAMSALQAAQEAEQHLQHVLSVCAAYEAAEAALKAIEVPPVVDVSEALAGIYGDMERLRAFKNAYAALVSAEQAVLSIKREAAQFAIEVESTQAALAEFKDSICPTCGQVTL